MEMRQLVADEYGNRHIITETLGKGGQGVVCKTTDEDIAIKLAMPNGQYVEDKAEIDRLNKSYRRVRLYPIPRGLHIAFPLAAIRGQAGYVMQLLGDMESFEHFGFTWNVYPTLDEADIPDYYKGNKALAERMVHYQKTGGLRRRLIALSAAAGILNRLHSAGLVYGDVSQNNIYVSKTDSGNVWFIDADNIRYDGNKSLWLYTPKFGAPEVVREESTCTSMSDVFAFAVLAYWMLTMCHPFEGAALTGRQGAAEVDWADDDGDGGGADDSMAIYDGRLAFVDDPNDKSNERQWLPSSLFVNEELGKLFQKTFCEGKFAPEERPPMMMWERALKKAAADTVQCPHCGQTFYRGGEHKPQTGKEGKVLCPYCDTKCNGGEKEAPLQIIHTNEEAKYDGE